MGSSRGTLTSVFVIIIASIIVSSCSNRFRLKATMKEFVKEEIIIPDNLYVVANRNYCKADFQNLDDSRLIIYIDSLSCNTCRITHLLEMLPLYEFSEEDGRFSILPIFSPKTDDLQDIERQLLLLDFPYPIYVDVFSEFAQKNNIPVDNRFHNFLIDEVGKVRFVGNPIDNEQLRSIFINTLNNINN